MALRTTSSVASKRPPGALLGLLLAAVACDGARSAHDQPAAGAIDAGDARWSALPAGDAGSTAIDAAVRVDAAAVDAVPDAGRYTAPRVPDDYAGPRRLSETGLYADAASGSLADGVRAYRPQGELWSDAADKRRFLLLPAGAMIDTADMDQWVFPTGTKLWKEFAHDGEAIETRLLEKLDDGSWRMIAFQWNEDHSDADAAPLGVKDARGTAHDIPDVETCHRCHDGRADRVLGVGALQLAHDASDVTLASLIAEGRLSDAPAAMPALPGDDTTREALRYLHANCGHCHNPTRARAEREISVYFWQEVDALGQLEDTVTYRSLVQDKPSPLWIDAVVQRMGDRGGVQQMPPVGTDVVDESGVALVEAFMAQLRAQRPDAPSAATGGPCPGVEVVFDIFERAACRNAFCHGAGTGELSFRTPAQLHDSLVGVAAIGEGCDGLGLPRVAPGDPAHSLLMIKLRPGPPCGKVMPPAMALSDDEIAAVEDWIAGCQ